MVNERAYFVTLAAAPGVGTVKFRALLSRFKKASRAWGAGAKELKETLGEATLEVFERYRNSVDPGKYLDSVLSKKISLLTLLDPDYPVRLKEIYDPPAVLYLKGEFRKEDNLALAVVGTRKITSYGKEVTVSLVSKLAQTGLTIVSGLARGVDSLAHKIALENGARTIAILGSGVDIIYPAENTALAAEISKNGCLISEVPPGVGPTRGYFPARNRIISGLSLGVLVTEAGEESGSLITASCALEQNREVFAVPGPIYSKLSQGPASLIKQGAKLVSQFEDIIDELNLDLLVKETEPKRVKSDNQEEQAVIDLLVNTTKHIDQLIRETGYAADKLSGLLLTMEIKGQVKNLGGGNYSLNS